MMYQKNNNNNNIINKIENYEEKKCNKNEIKSIQGFFQTDQD